MFELSIRCSRDLKKIVIDFEGGSSMVSAFDDTQVSPPVSERVVPSVSKPKAEQPDMADIIAARASAIKPVEPKQKPKADTASQATVPDVTNRPPKVDEDFNETF